MRRSDLIVSVRIVWKWDCFASLAMTESEAHLIGVVMNPFLIIMGFYFAAHVVRTAMSGKSQ